MCVLAVGDDELVDVGDNDDALWELAGGAGRPGGVTRMDLERQITGNGTRERLVPDGTWVLPGIAGEREFSGTSLSRLVDVTNIHLSHCEVKSWMFSAAV